MQRPGNACFLSIGVYYNFYASNYGMQSNDIMNNDTVDSNT
jgi:hypothetical protein